MKLSLIIIVLSIVCFATSCAKAQELPVEQKTPTKPMQQTQATELTEAQAIEFAEKFIEQNGYTDLSPDKENLAYESIEWESNVDEMLKMRHNTLERKAFCGLLTHPKSQERIMGMMQTGKPVRN